MTTPSIQSTLLTNAVFSALAGLTMSLLPQWWSDQIFTAPNLVFRLLGIGLLIFALDVYLVSRKTRTASSRVMAIFMADLLWVVVTPIVMAIYFDRFTALGFWLTVDVAIIVAVFAMLEWHGMRQPTVN